MNEEQYIVFDQYLQGELSREEQSLFEINLIENPELAASFQIFQEAQAHLSSKFGIEQERNAFIANLKTIASNQSETNRPKVVFFKPWMYAVAASVVVMMGLFVSQFNSNPSFEEYNQHENAYFTERSEADGTLKKAEIAFNAKEYATAIPIFEALLKVNKTPEIQYFYGIALLENNNIKESEVVFKALQSGNSIYVNKAIWSLALAKLKQKDYTSCKEILLTIPSDYENYDQVQDLIQQLD